MYASNQAAEFRPTQQQHNLEQQPLGTDLDDDANGTKYTGRFDI